MAQHYNNSNINSNNSSSSSPLLLSSPKNPQQRTWIDYRCVPTGHDIVFINDEESANANNSKFKNSLGRKLYQQLLDEYYEDYFNATPTPTPTPTTTTTSTARIAIRSSTLDEEHNRNLNSSSLYTATIAGGRKAIFYNSIPINERSRIRKKISSRFKKESGGRFIEQHKESLDSSSSSSSPPGSSRSGSSPLPKNKGSPSTTFASPTTACCYYYKKIYTKQRIHDKIDESFHTMRKERGDNTSVVPAAAAATAAITATASPPLPIQAVVPPIADAARTTATTITTAPISQQQQQQQWTKVEHAAFIKAIHHYGTSNWKLVSSFVASRSEKQTKDYGYYSFMGGGTNDESYWTIDDYDLLLEKAPFNWKYIDIGWNKDIIRMKLIQKKERQKAAANKLKANRKLTSSPTKKNKSTIATTTTNNNVAAASSAKVRPNYERATATATTTSQQQQQQQQQQQHLYPYQQHQQLQQLQQQQFNPHQLLYQQMLQRQFHPHRQQQQQQQQHPLHSTNAFVLNSNYLGYTNTNTTTTNTNNNNNNLLIQNNPPPPPNLAPPLPHEVAAEVIDQQQQQQHQEEQDIISISSGDDDDDDNNSQQHQEVQQDIIEIVDSSDDDDNGKDNDSDNDNDTLDGGNDDAFARNHDGSLDLCNDRYPSKWDPTHPKIAKVLSTYEEKFIAEFPDGLSPGIADSPVKCINSVVQFCDGYPKWKQSYPVIMAIAANDVIRLKYLINLDVESIHKKMDTDGIASGPGDWASYLGRLHCFIVLLKAGLNPWEDHVWADAEKENIIPLLELKADLELVNLEACSPSAALTTENNDEEISSSTNYDEKSPVDDGKLEGEGEVVVCEQEENEGVRLVPESTNPTDIIHPPRHINTNNYLKIQHLLQRTLTSAANTTAAAVLDPMLYEIGNSPYEGNRCAETGENDLDELKKLMEPVVVGGPPKMNPKLEPLFGDTLADANVKARIEILKQPNVLFDSSWKEGKIGNADLGWIPSRQLLLCLQEENFGDAKFGTESTIQTIVRELDCFELTMEALKFWNLKYEFPILASNKNEEAFWFKDKSQRLNCWKCQIFVARTYATLQILKKNKKSDKIKPSLMRKIKAYLGIMNDHVNSNVAEHKRLLEKKDEKKKLKVKITTTTVKTMKKKKPVGSKAKKMGLEPTKKAAPVKPKKKKLQKMAGPKTTGLDGEDCEQPILDFSIRSRSNHAKRKIGIKKLPPHKTKTRVMKHKLKRPPPSSSNRKNNITATATTASSSSQARKSKTRTNIKTVVASTNKNKKNVKGNTGATAATNTIRRTAAAAAAVVHPFATAVRSSHPQPEFESSEPTARRQYKNVIDGTCEERESILITGFSIIEKQLSQMTNMMNFFEQQLQPENQYIFKQEIRDNVLDERREREREQREREQKKQSRKVFNSTKDIKKKKKRKKGNM